MRVSGLAPAWELPVWMRNELTRAWTRQLIFKVFLSADSHRDLLKETYTNVWELNVMVQQHFQAYQSESALLHSIEGKDIFPSRIWNGFNMQRMFVDMRRIKGVLQELVETLGCVQSRSQYQELPVDTFIVYIYCMWNPCLEIRGTDHCGLCSTGESHLRCCCRRQWPNSLINITEV